MTERAQEQAELTATQVLSVYAAYLAGQISGPDFERAAAISVYAGKVIASRLADITVSTMRGLPPVGIVPGPDHLDRLAGALSTITEEPEPTEEPEGPQEGTTARLTRLAEAETLLSHRKSLHAALKAQGYTEWVRIVEDDACEICAPLAGKVYTIDQQWKDHPGCRCSLAGHGIPEEPTQTPRAAEEPLFRISKEVRRVRTRS